MTLIFFEVSEFTRVIDRYFGDDEGYRLMQASLLESPDRGRVIRGAGGLRKLRWSDPRRGKGKRGGLRIIYLYVPEAQHVLLLDVYDKSEADDLSPATRRALAEVARSYSRSVAQRSTRQGRTR